MFVGLAEDHFDLKDYGCYENKMLDFRDNIITILTKNFVPNMRQSVFSKFRAIR